MKKIYTFIIFALILCQVYAQPIAGNWTQTGPVNFPANQTPGGQINGIGRICQIKFHPTNASIMYAVSATGSLWKSTDGAQTWQKTGTDNLPHTNSASICIDYTNDQILYLGTGDPDYYNRGYGIWKSTDGGASWKISTKGLDYRLVEEILMDPLNHNVLLAATDDGIWKSTNAGATWTLKKTGGSFTDMILKPNSRTRTVYAATKTDFWVSYNMGDTWTQVALPGSGFSKGGRIGVSKADTNRVYVTFVGDYNKDDYTLSLSTPVLKSTNSGQSFTVVKPANSTNLNGYSQFEGGQENYNYDITVDPSNANLVYIVGHIIWKSTDGGVTWNSLEAWYEKIHTDMHQIEVSPYNGSKIFNANDGGVWLSQDQGANWTPVSNGLAVTEFYHAAQAKTSKDTVYGGTQDNGEVFLKGSNWYTSRGGDVASKLATDYQNNSYYLKWGTRRTFANPDQSFNMPVPAPNDNGNGDDIELEFSPVQTTLAFLGKNKIYRTRNLTSSTPTWDSVALNGAQIKAITPSPADANVVYVVTEDQTVYRSDNALATTPTYTPYTAPAPTNLRASIAVVKSNPSVVYMSCGNRVFRSADKGVTWTEITYNLPAINILKMYNDDYSSDESVYLATALGVYYKNNTMNTWQNYSKGLPTVANISEFMMFNNGTSRSTLRVAYYGRGVWETPLLRQPSIKVAIVSPSDNATFAEGSSIILNATASSTSGAITKVEFYNGGTLLGTSTTSPYSYTWNNVPAGNYSVTAKAYTATGNNTAPFLVRLSVLKLRTPENPASVQAALSYNLYHGVFNNTTDLASATPVRTGTVNYFNLSPSDQLENFGIIYTGFINISTDGVYTFYTSSDDGTLLYIGDSIVVNNDGLHGNQEQTGIIGLKSGAHAIKVAFIQQGGDTALHVSYSGYRIPKQIIPASVLYHGSTACNFGTPTSTALPSITYTTYSHSYTLGQGGPNLSNVTSFNIQWDLAQNTLYTLSMNTSNGIPAYYVDLKAPKSTNTFASPSPAITFTNSGITGLDGSYYVTKRSNGDFVMASTTGQFALYFTNSATQPTCSATRLAYIVEPEGTSLTPNPAQDNVEISTGMELEKAVLAISNSQGLIISVPYTISGSTIHLNTGSLGTGVYTVTIQSEEQVAVKRMIIAR